MLRRLGYGAEPVDPADDFIAQRGRVLSGNRRLCLVHVVPVEAHCMARALSLFDAFSWRNPASTSLENAMIDTSSMPADHAASLSLVAAPIRLTSRKTRKSSFNSGLPGPFW